MLKLAARWFLRINGWEAEGGRPIEKRFVLIAAPHTSNWDLPYMLALAVAFDLKISWMGKHTLFHPPLSWVMRALGGIPVVRHRRESLVSALARTFEDAESLALVVPAEGTRAYVAHWKSGFYHIAHEAGVPIITGYLDYRRKRGGFGPALYTTGDISSDMEQIRDFYADKTGKYPDKFGEVRLKEEM
jgi:1-acyl-sn-glycerol-3-phosphate acyltransferase